MEEAGQKHTVNLHGPVRRKERAITDRAEIDAILNEGKVMHLALSLHDRPFLVPLFYVYDGQALYFHSAQQGTKIEILKQNPHVCFEVSLGQGVIPSDKACDFEARHRTVIGAGTAAFLEDEEQKRHALDAIVGRFTKEKFTYPAPMFAHTAIVRIAIQSLNGKKHGHSEEGFSL
ncbi:MAG: pyridoxamine 5'-phosphate oxidase family protein [Terracidiphilus sp.]|nr:pyridoxamine 5'-phosphate oxidase family protein [Terracidiphilus sp.]